MPLTALKLMLLWFPQLWSLHMSRPVAGQPEGYAARIVSKLVPEQVDTVNVSVAVAVQENQRSEPRPEQEMGPSVSAPVLLKDQVPSPAIAVAEAQSSVWAEARVGSPLSRHPWGGMALRAQEKRAKLAVGLPGRHPYLTAQYRSSFVPWPTCAPPNPDPLRASPSRSLGTKPGRRLG